MSALKHQSDPSDPRDYKLPDRPVDSPRLATTVDLRPYAPPVYSQGGLNSCTANATAALLDFVRKKDGLEFMSPSRMFLYYNARLLNGNADKDEGSCFRDMLNSIYETGACSESMWDYNKDLLFVKPVDECYAVAANNKFQYYAYIAQRLEALKHCLDDGFPFLFALMVYWPLQNDIGLHETGFLTETPERYRNHKGRHALCCVGYDDEKEAFLIRNSHGPDWCMEGHFWIKYKMMIDPVYCEAFWTLRTSGTWESTEYN
ncbi:C1 family peptidase [Pedobacter foliorum]|uniref:C1 family peptidase n=1 Tax=Pedobacter foliorum TaxID=2739058 RepID=UPI001565B0FC|nr:C1 family peptidase [Pedobacter foliorum]NRF40115.1 C1 family peptidase [Pedobacter foliorum]